MYAIRAFGGSFFILNSLVSVVDIGTAAGVSSNMFFSCTFALSAAASAPKQQIDAAMSKKAHVLFGFGGGSQPKELSCRLVMVLLT